MAFDKDRKGGRNGRNSEDQNEYIEKVVAINRVSKTVTGGRVM